MRFSIIVPVYNVEKYIEKCMESLVNQSFHDYEIIVVDDESPDRSMDIVEAYRSREPEKIRVIHQKNTRQGGARNHGVELALGEYLIFVDSDDYVSRGMLEILDRRLKETACDILAFRYVSVEEDGTLLPEEITSEIKPGLYCPRTDQDVLLLSSGPVNKVFRREFYIGSGFQFPEKLLYEDCMTRILYAKAKSILVTEDELYYSVHRENSSMTQAISEKMLDIVTMADLTLKEFRRCGLYETFRDPLEVSVIYCLLCVLNIINLQQPDHPMQKNIADFIKENFPGYRENTYATPALIRSLDLLTAYEFKRYHWQCLRLNRFKESLLRIPFFARLNEIRKHL